MILPSLGSASSFTINSGSRRRIVWNQWQGLLLIKELHTLLTWSFFNASFFTRLSLRLSIEVFCIFIVLVDCNLVCRTRCSTDFLRWLQFGLRDTDKHRSLLTAIWFADKITYRCSLPLSIITSGCHFSCRLASQLTRLPMSCFISFPSSTTSALAPQQHLLIHLMLPISVWAGGVLFVGEDEFLFRLFSRFMMLWECSLHKASQGQLHRPLLCIGF